MCGEPSEGFCWAILTWELTYYLVCEIGPMLIIIWLIKNREYKVSCILLYLFCTLITFLAEALTEHGMTENVMTMILSQRHDEFSRNTQSLLVQRTSEMETTKGLQSKDLNMFGTTFTMKADNGIKTNFGSGGEVMELDTSLFRNEVTC